jgi:hypothetical protein
MAPHAETLQRREGGTRSFGPWLAVTATVLVAAGIRAHFLDVPLERDEGEYAYVGQLLLQGVLPFKLAWNMKLPGTYAAYALFMGLFGQTIAGVRLGLLLANGATTVLLYLLGRRLLGIAGGITSAAAFACLSLSPGLHGPFAHANHFALPFGIAGALVLLSTEQSRGGLRFFSSGLLFGLGILMKQPAAVFPVFGLAWLSWTRLCSEGGESRRWLRDSVTLVAGAILPLAVTVALLAAGGVLDRFRFWVIDYARAYASGLSLEEGARVLETKMSLIASQAIVLWAMAAAGLVLVAAGRFGGRVRVFLVALLALSFLGVCPGLYFRNNYFILLLPAVALLVGAAAAAVARVAARAGTAVSFAAVVAVSAVAFGHALYSERATYFELSPNRVSRLIYPGNPFPESLEVARYLREHTTPDDTIAVLGSEPQIPFYARRRSATGYIYTYPLVELQPYARAMQEDMIRQIEATRPAYVVWVSIHASWLVTPESDQMIFAWATRYLRQDYEVCGKVFMGPDRTEFFWESEVDRAPPEEAQIVVLRRKGFTPPVRG